MAEMPKLNWSDAPDWATLHVYQSWGAGFWGSAEPIPGTLPHNLGRWSFPSWIKSRPSGYVLPIGIDFRESIEYRPQEEVRDVQGEEIDLLRAEVERLTQTVELLRAMLKLQDATKP